MTTKVVAVVRLMFPSSKEEKYNVNLVLLGDKRNLRRRYRNSNSASTNKAVKKMSCIMDQLDNR